MENVLAIIPARGGSKGVPRKNLSRLADIPLLAYSILAAHQAERVSRIVVSTEDDEIADVARSWGAEVVPRPLELATDEAATDPVLEQVVSYLHETEGYQPDIVVLLQPTSPLRPEGLVDECIKHLIITKADSVLTVFEGHHFYWKKGPSGLTSNYEPANRPRRQDIPEQDRILLENGSVYVIRYAMLLEHHSRLAGKIEWYVMDPEDSLEIDTPNHFHIAEALLIRRRTNEDTHGVE